MTFWKKIGLNSFKAYWILSPNEQYWLLNVILIELCNQLQSTNSSSFFRDGNFDQWINDNFDLSS